MEHNILKQLGKNQGSSGLCKGRQIISNKAYQYFPLLLRDQGCGKNEEMLSDLAIRRSFLALRKQFNTQMREVSCNAFKK